MYNLLKKIIPKRLRLFIYHEIRAPLKLLRIDAILFHRFWKYNVRGRGHNQEFLERTILMLAHTTEKGFSLRSPRDFFGFGNLDVLMDCLDKASALEGFSDRVIAIGEQAIAGYIAKHEGISGKPHELEYIAKISAWLEQRPKSRKADEVTTMITLEGVLSNCRSGVSAAIESRHSVRRYADQKPDVDLVMEAIRVAQRSPSACNLQPTRVHVITDDDLIQKSLVIQGGSNGFREEVPLLLAISYDVGLQVGGPRSRNQGMCDSGLFSMALMLALLERGLGSCPLNWAKDPHEDKAFRKLIGIPDQNQVVMLISVGHLQESLEVAFSERRKTEDIVTFVGEHQKKTN